MTFEDTANVIRARFKLLITDVEGIEVHHDNQKKERPSGSLWVRLSIRSGETSQVSMGASERYRTIGIVTVSIFVPIGTGMKRAHALTDKVVTAFRGNTDTGVVFRAPRQVTVGRTEEWWQVNVIVPFYVDDLT